MADFENILFRIKLLNESTCAFLVFLKIKTHVLKTSFGKLTILAGIEFPVKNIAASFEKLLQL